MKRIEYGIREFWGEEAVPFIARLYGNSTAESISKPLSTISCSGAQAAATGFPSDYKFTGTKVEVVKQIGNAVPPNFAKAIFGQILKEMIN